MPAKRSHDSSYASHADADATNTERARGDALGQCRTAVVNVDIEVAAYPSSNAETERSRNAN